MAFSEYMNSKDVLQFQAFSRIMVGINVAIPLFFPAFGIIAYTQLYECLGEEYQLFFRENNKGSFKNDMNNILVQP